MKSTIAFVFLSFSVAHMVLGKNITSLSDLNIEIEKRSDTVAIGFLSQGNYQAVQNELHTKVEPKIFKHVEDIYASVQNRSIVAGLISGTPDKKAQNIHVFPSNQISVRSMLIKQGNSLVEEAIDTAIVLIVEQGKVEQMAQNNPPYEALVVHSCKPSSSHYVWPNKDQLTKVLALPTQLMVGALGPYNWGKADGDYTKTPFKGFWPEYYDELNKEIENQYNISLVRKWYKSSTALLDALANGDVDTTEPYMMVGSAYNSVARKTAFDLSCITSATQDKYFTKIDNPKPVPLVSGDTVDQTLVIALSTVGGVCLVSLLLLLVVVWREKQGKPMFGQSLLEEYKEKNAKVVDNTGIAMA